MIQHRQHYNPFSVQYSEKSVFPSHVTPRFPDMLLKKKSHLAQTNDLVPATPYAATNQDPGPVPTSGTGNIFTLFFLWRNSP